MKKRVSGKLLLISGTLFFLALAFLGGFVFLLNQPKVGEKTLSWIIAQSSSQEMRVSCQAARWTILEELFCENLQLQMVDPQGRRLTIKVGRVHLKYSLLSLIGGELQVGQIHLWDGQVEGAWSLAEIPESEEAMALPVWPGWLSRVNVKDVQMKNWQVDLLIHQGEQSRRFQWTDLEILSSRLAQLEKRTQWQVASDLRVAWNHLGWSGSSTGVSELIFQLKTEDKIDWSLSHHFSQVVLEHGIGNLGELSIDAFGSTSLQLAQSEMACRLFIQKEEVASLDFDVGHGDSSQVNWSGKLQVSPEQVPIEEMKQLGRLILASTGEMSSKLSWQDLLLIEDFQNWPLRLKMDHGFTQDAAEVAQPLMTWTPLRWRLEWQQGARNPRQGNSEMTIDQWTMESHRGENLRWTLLVAEQETASEAEGWRLESGLIADGLQSPLLLSEAAVDLRLQAHWLPNFSRVTSQLHAEWQGVKAMDLDMKLAEDGEGTDLVVASRFWFGPHWQALLPTSLLKIVEEWQLSAKIGATADRKREALVAQLTEDWRKLPLVADISLDLSSLANQATRKRAPLHFRRPISLKAEGKQSSNAWNFVLDLELPHLSVKSLGELREGGLQLRGEQKEGGVASSWQGLLDVRKALVSSQAIEGLQGDLDLGSLSTEVLLSHQPSGRFDIQRAQGRLDDDLLIFELLGRGDYQRGNFNLRGDVQLGQRKKISLFPGASFRGKVRLPWSLVMQENRFLDIDGTLDLSQVSVEQENFSVADLTGQILLSESLVRRNGEWQLSRVLQRNPFERVDFQRFQPFLAEAEPLLVKSLRWQEKELGPLSGFFSLQQNLLTVQKLHFRLGAGEMAGEAFADLYPGQQSLGALVRLSDLRLADVIPKDALGGRVGSREPIAGRMGMVFQLDQGTLEGRMDVTRIGREPVLTLIDFLDPKLEDENLNLARKGLSLGYPTGLFLGIDQGVLDFDLRLGGAAGLIGQVRAPSVPISGLLSTVSAELEETSKAIGDGS